jgi:glycosyltransferase involved in cell wall biosynthesis
MLGKGELCLFYKSLDIYIHTSNYEGFGLVVGDALANGIPVVSTNVAGSRDLIKHSKNGFISYNTRDQIRYLNKLVEDSELRGVMSKNALAFAMDELNYDKMEDKIIESILKTLAK